MGPITFFLTVKKAEFAKPNLHYVEIKIIPHQSNQPLKLCTEIFEKANDFKRSSSVMRR